jgi:hypothetical protein
VLANGDHIGGLKETPKPLPVFFVGERIQIGPYGLIDVHTQGSMELFCDSRDIRQAQIV